MENNSNEKTKEALDSLSKRSPINRKKIIVGILALAVILFGSIAIYLTVIKPANQYQAAVEALENSDYDLSLSLFTELGNYKDSADKIKEATYEKALSLMNSGEYEKASKIFESVIDYKDSSVLNTSCVENASLQLDTFINKYNLCVSDLNKDYVSINISDLIQSGGNYQANIDNGATVTIYTEDNLIYEWLYVIPIENITDDESYESMKYNVSALMGCFDITLTDDQCEEYTEELLNELKENGNGSEPNFTINNIEYYIYAGFLDNLYIMALKV